MKLSEFIELCKMIDLLANEGEKIKDFSISDGRRELYITLESGAAFAFTLDE